MKNEEDTFNDPEADAGLERTGSDLRASVGARLVDMLVR